MRNKLSLIIAIVAVAIAGFSFARSRRDAQVELFKPYTITQHQVRLNDDVSEQLQADFRIYTGADGTMREVRTFLNQEGKAQGEPTEQLVQPGVGGFFVNHTARTVTKFNNSTAAVPKVTAETYRSSQWFDRTENLPNGFVAYVDKMVDDHGTTEIWRSPEFGMALVGYRYRPPEGGYLIIRRTLSIEPGADSNVLGNYSGYKQEVSTTSAPLQ